MAINTEKNKISPVVPIVVVMGHVDHGKTTLLDFIRKTKIALGEHGGITQAIGAYQAKITTKEGERLMTFIDTPGHEAFSAMRSRGATVADVAILVVAGDDGIMPQTKEAIAHIKKSNIPYIVAVNKADLPTVNIERIKRQLSKEDVLVEGYGGDIVVLPISAKNGTGIDELLELLILVSDLSTKDKDINPESKGFVIESQRDSHKGPIATVIVKNTTLTVGQTVYAGTIKAKIRGMFDEYGKSLKEAGEGKPVEIIGWEEVPPVGSIVTDSEQLPTAVAPATMKMPTGAGESSETVLNVILKADTVGSLEALKALIPEDAAILIEEVGDVNESDVLYAKTTKSIIIGFNVKVLSKAARLAELERVIVKTEPIIYRLAEDVQEVVEALKSGGLEEVLGTARVLAEFPMDKLRVAGIRVLEGRIARGDSIKLIRENEEVGRGKIESLRLGKNEATKAETSQECGIIISGGLDFKVGDDIISYRI